ncbi:MAG: VanZ family protein [Clostridiales bacterium]|nr:VanZ family protein [Clostridiales bacterium]
MRLDFSAVILSLPVYVLMFLYKTKMSKKSSIIINWKRESLVLLFTIYLFALLSITVFPISFRKIYESGAFVSVNLVPFKYVIRSIGTVGESYSGDIAFHVGLIAKNVIGNLLLLFPFGLTVPVLWKNTDKLSYRVLYGLILTFGIESIQFMQMYFGFSMGRVVDIDDIILNSIGFIIGYTISNKLLKTKIVKGFVDEHLMRKAS